MENIGIKETVSFRKLCSALELLGFFYCVKINVEYNYNWLQWSFCASKHWLFVFIWSLFLFSCCFSVVYLTFAGVHAVITCEMTQLWAQSSNEKANKGTHFCIASLNKATVWSKSPQLSKHLAFYIASCCWPFGLHGHEDSCWHCYHCISC